MFLLLSFSQSNFSDDGRQPTFLKPSHVWFCSQ